jgi:hypothetical protein
MNLSREAVVASVGQSNFAIVDNVKQRPRNAKDQIASINILQDENPTARASN